MAAGDACPRIYPQPSLPNSPSDHERIFALDFFGIDGEELGDSIRHDLFELSAGDWLEAAQEFGAHEAGSEMSLRNGAAKPSANIKTLNTLARESMCAAKNTFF
jgi:hypothetical protein